MAKKKKKKSQPENQNESTTQPNESVENRINRNYWSRWVLGILATVIATVAAALIITSLNNPKKGLKAYVKIERIKTERRIPGEKLRGFNVSFSATPELGKDVKIVFEVFNSNEQKIKSIDVKTDKVGKGNVSELFDQDVKVRLQIVDAQNKVLAESDTYNVSY